MDPVSSAFVSSWQWRPSVLVVLLTLGALYTLGWRRLRARTAGRRPASRFHLSAPWRPLAYWGGLLAVGLALLSPIDVFGNQLFIMHMVQHILLVMIAPPLLLIANPLPFVLWGMPHGVRSEASRVLSQGSSFRRLLRATTGPGIVWLLFVAAYIGWHDPQLYDAALRYEWVHDLEHLSFFLSAMLVWWHITGAGPRVHGRFPAGARAAYAMSFVPPNMIAGIVIAFAQSPIYGYYTAVPRLWGISVMQDQQWGGIIMWVPGSMMFIIAALVLLYRLFGAEDDRPLVRHADWATEGAMIAPGLKK